MRIPKLYVMCGLPCSGKSHRAQELSDDAIVVSSDVLRAEMFGDVNCQEHNQELFVELHRRIKGFLKLGHNVVYDACNISYKRRMAFLQELKNIQCEKICVLMATPYKQCLSRNAARDRKVPETVIRKMLKNFDIPYWYEGWDEIEIEYSLIGMMSSFRSDYFPCEWCSSVINFQQENKHHTLSLGSHCFEALYHIAGTYELDDEDEDDEDASDYNALYVATAIHDLGKIDCKTFVNSKGKKTQEAHYYGHEHTGSYHCLFFDYGADPLDVAVLIRWHMQPYYWERDNNEKLHSKYRKLWGEQLYQDIMKLHEADKAAH